jgi:hypothetical protein
MEERKQIISLSIYESRTPKHADQEVDGRYKETTLTGLFITDQGENYITP